MTKSSIWSVCNALPLLTDGYRITICDQILTIFCEPCTEKHVLVIPRWGKRHTSWDFSAVQCLRLHFQCWGPGLDP